MSSHAYQLLHSDAFTAELEALGLDSALFGAAGVSAPVFQALVPRSATVFDTKANTFGTEEEPSTFARSPNTDGTYRDRDGNWQVTSGERPHFDASGVFQGHLFEPAITNKAENYNDASSLTGLTASGDPAGTLATVADSELAAAGLSALTAGQCFEMDNSGGSADYIVTVTGTFANTNTHTLSAWVKVVTAGATHTMRSNGGSPSTTFTNTTWARISVSGGSGASNQVEFRASAGAVIRFVLNQLEELSTETTPIITAGASASRSAESLQWPQLPAKFSQDAGVLCVDILPQYTKGISGPGNHGCVTVGSSGFGILYFGGSTQLKTFDGTTSITLTNKTGSFSSGEHMRVVVRWNSTTSKQELLAWNADDGWRASGEAAYDGAWDYSGADRLQVGVASLPICVKRLAIWNRDIGAAEIQRLFTP